MGAHDAVYKAIRSGELVRGRCEQENEGDCSGRIEGHHDDYSKPLDVRWLCVSHHRRFHASRRKRVKRLSVSLPVELVEALKIRAGAESRSVSNMMSKLLHESLATDPKVK